jgi:molecular chaperone DnaK (HSP70)
LTRTKFEALNADLFLETLGSVDRVLAEADVKKGDINEVSFVRSAHKVWKN